MSPQWEVADIIRRFGEEFQQRYPVNNYQWRILNALKNCRTAAMGGHVYACNQCGALHFAYNSCRNRHCPKCQAIEREAWIIARQAELLPVPYYHVVFTIPHQLNDLCRHNEAWMYNLLFKAAWQVLQSFAANPKWLGAKTGATMVLHTWGQNLELHPHVHCIVPGGGLTADGEWKSSQVNGKFLFPVAAMRKVFRAIFLKAVFKALKKETLLLPDDFPQGNDFRRWRQKLYGKNWVIYAKRPFPGPQAVIEYLGRYTHKVAISNHRLLEIGEKKVGFSYKKYSQDGKKLKMELDGVEFLRRFCLHILPKGFRRMRHYGILSNALKTKALVAARKSIQTLPPQQAQLTRSEQRMAAVVKLLGHSRDTCPHCKEGKLLLIGIIPSQRAPPDGQMPHWIPCETDDLQ
jgi:Putative transposase/Transposase zinc-binding domain